MSATAAWSSFNRFGEFLPRAWRRALCRTGMVLSVARASLDERVESEACRASSATAGGPEPGMRDCLSPLQQPWRLQPSQMFAKC